VVAEALVIEPWSSEEIEGAAMRAAAQWKAFGIEAEGDLS
jgi:hypothetical protein